MKRAYPFLVLLISVLPGVGEAKPENILAMDGLGKVHIGMTLKQAEAALGAKLNPPTQSTYGYGQSSTCATTERADGRDAEVEYMLGNGHIDRIDVAPSQPGGAQSPITTAAGIGLGSTEAEIKAAYGKNVAVKPHPYLEGDKGHYFVVDAPDHKKGIVFETADGKVTSFRAGEAKAVALIRGCALN